MRGEDPQRVARDVGRRIAEIRTASGLTQERFAERASVSLKYVQHVEGGKANLTLASLVKFAGLLGVRTVDLLAVPASREVRRGRPVRQPPA